MSAAALVRDLAAFSVQIALVVLAVAVLVKLVHIPARTRYHGLRLVLAVSLLAPWMLRSPDAPPVTKTVTAQPAGGVAMNPAGALPGTPSPRAAVAAPATRLPDIPWAALVLGAVLIGVAGRGLWLAVGLTRLRRMTKTGTVVEEPEYTQLQEQIGARATIAQVMGLAQPATYGVRSPVVLLPDALADAPASFRRAVVIHELFHVRRRDWLFVLAEEIVRTVLWFHPAILWLTSHIQLAREEIVDELTVRATGDRRAYMQALLAFADSGSLRPAPAFAHRRQLFHRILSVSKEKVMSRPRIVISTVVLVAVVSAASWYASSLFPILEAGAVVALEPASLLAVQDDTQSAAPAGLLAPEVLQRPAPTRSRVVGLDQQSGAAVTPRPVTPENPIPRRTRGATPAWPAQYANAGFQIAVNTFVTLDRNGAVINVRRGGCAASEPGPGLQGLEDACRAFFDTSAVAIRQWRYDRPAQPPLEFNVVVSFRPGAEPEVLQSGAPIAVASSRDYAGPAMIPNALADHSTADAYLRERLAEVTRKLREIERAYRIETERGYLPGHPSIDVLLRDLAVLNDQMQMLQERLRTSSATSPEHLTIARQDLERARRVLREAERQLAESRRQPEQTVTADVRPTPTTPFDGSQQLRSPSGRAPIRVGGAITPPRPIKSPKPAYTAEAMAARVEGTVVMEALVDEQGRVADARVLRSIPLLDESALAAAKEWEFTPSLLNGQPVPVLVMLELEFNLRK